MFINRENQPTAKSSTAKANLRKICQISKNREENKKISFHKK